MNYQVTARKWRPMVFDDVIGQTHITNTLRNAIAYNRIAHAYLFSGLRGCGKTTTARIFARTLNCTSPVDQNPDNSCPNCKSIIEGRSLDVIEIDGASNRGIEEIRNLRDSVRFMPTQGKYKIYIIDEVHMLTKEAFNALLKTLEEPPAHVIFIFATTEVHKVPPTILSRCQRFDFRRIAVSEIIDSLKKIAQAENISVEEDAFVIIGKRADGSLRDAQSIFDQVRTFCGTDIKTSDLLKAFNVVDQDIYFRLTDLFKKHDSTGTIQLVDEIVKSGYDLSEFVVGLAEHLRNLLIAQTTKSTQLIETSEHYKKSYKAEAENFSELDLLRYIKQTNELEQAMRWAVQPRYKLESVLVQMAKMEKSVKLEELLHEIETLKNKLNDNDAALNYSAGHEKLKSKTSEIKIIGDVGAGYITGAHSYMPPKPIVEQSLINNTGITNILESAPSMDKKDRVIENTEATLNPTNLLNSSIQSSILPIISREEVNKCWPELINTISKSHIAIGTSLTTASVLDVKNGLIRILCPDDYNFNNLKRNKSLLTTVFHKIIGRHVDIEPVLRSNPNIPVKDVFTTKSSEVKAQIQDESSASNKELDEHPILQIFKRELGAERINLT